MSEEQLKAFIAKVKDDQSIQEKLKEAKTADEVVGIARDHGHEFTADKLTETLSDEELEGVVGGGPHSAGTGYWDWNPHPGGCAWCTGKGEG